MQNLPVEVRLYEGCLFEIQRRIDVIKDHLTQKRSEGYLIVEVEILCLQFRKILEKIVLMSLVANKEVYAAQHEKFAKHYHAKYIMRDLERINPDFYPTPITRVKIDEMLFDLVSVEEGYLTKEELVDIYERCGAMMHTENPFATPKSLQTIKAYQNDFREWLDKICILLKEHKITLADKNIMVIGVLERNDNGRPQVLVFETIKEGDEK